MITFIQLMSWAFANRAVPGTAHSGGSYFQTIHTQQVPKATSLAYQLVRKAKVIVCEQMVMISAMTSQGVHVWIGLYWTPNTDQSSHEVLVCIVFVLAVCIGSVFDFSFLY